MGVNIQFAAFLTDSIVIEGCSGFWFEDLKRFLEFGRLLWDTEGQ